MNIFYHYFHWDENSKRRRSSETVFKNQTGLFSGRVSFTEKAGEKIRTKIRRDLIFSVYLFLLMMSVVHPFKNRNLPIFCPPAEFFRHFSFHYLLYCSPSLSLSLSLSFTLSLSLSISHSLTLSLSLVMDFFP